MRAWEQLSEDEKLKAIYDKHERFEEGFGIIERRFDAIDDRLDVMDKRLDAMDERFDRIEALIAKTHRDFRFLTGHVMFIEQTSYLIFSLTLSDSVKKRILQNAKSGTKKLEQDPNFDDAMVEGLKSGQRVMEQYFETVS